LDPVTILNNSQTAKIGNKIKGRATIATLIIRAIGTEIL
jgi:hypothetical protein